MRSAALIAASFSIFGCSTKPNAPASYASKSLPFSQALVQYWFEDDTLLLYVQDRIVIYDLKTKKTLSGIALNPEVSKQFSENLMSLDLGINTEDTASESNVTKLYYEPLCLSETAAVLALSSSVVAFGTYRIDRQQPEAYGEVADRYVRASHYDPQNCTQKTLFEEVVNTRFDRAKSQYVTYPIYFPPFSNSPQNWSITAQVLSAGISTDTEGKESVTLPAGPWVHSYGLLKTMSCFSCGCSCYENIEMQAENGQIYLMPYGAAVDEQHRGIYKLNRDSTPLEWKPIKLGKQVSSTFAVAPDGCRIAVSEAGVPQIIDTCDRPD